jgi:pimeloyl-ACP methyl ester carboxylesterase
MSHVDSVDDFSNDIDHFITQHFKDEPELVSKLILVGWSLGGMITMNMAANWPNKYKKIYLVSSGMISGYPCMKEIVFFFFTF